jgi:hypothetical protein
MFHYRSPMMSNTNHGDIVSTTVKYIEDVFYINNSKI